MDPVYSTLYWFLSLEIVYLQYSADRILICNFALQYWIDMLDPVLIEIRIGKYHEPFVSIVTECHKWMSDVSEYTVYNIVLHLLKTCIHTQQHGNRSKHMVNSSRINTQLVSIQVRNYYTML